MHAMNEMRTPDQPRPEDSDQAIRKLQNALVSTTAALGHDLLQELGESTAEAKWSVITRAIEGVEHATAEKFEKIALVILREVLTRQPPPSSDEVLAHFMQRMRGEIEKIKPPQ